MKKAFVHSTITVKVKTTAMVTIMVTATTIAVKLTG